MDIEIVAATLTYRKVMDGRYSPEEKVLFRYSNALPFAVHLFFPKTSWKFSRELLVGAIMFEPTDEDVYADEDASAGDGVGDGDVHVRLVADGVEITLQSPTGHSVLLFDLDEVSDALDATRRLVPYGEESAVFDVDSWLAESFPEAG
jgi:hypothetical protein